MNNLHISLTNIKNESRLFKTAKTLIKKNIFDKIVVVGLHENDLKTTEEFSKNIILKRIKLRTKTLPKNLFAQLLKYFEFLLVILFNFKKYHVITIHSLGLLPLGILYKLFYKSKLIYDAHEYETETQGLKGIRKKLSKIIEILFIKYCDKVICVSDAIAKEYVKLYSIEKPALVLNTPLYQNIKKENKFRESLNISTDKIIFLYQGGFSSGRGIEILLDTFKQINDDKSVIVFMGYGELEELVIKTSQDYKNIYFHKAVSPDMLLSYTCSADFGILFYENNCLNHYYCSPNKMFEYLMADIPVIVSNLYEMKRLVENNDIGVVAKENTSDGLENAIKKASLLDKKELNKNIQKVKKIYNWEEQEKIILDIYKDLYEN